MSESQRLLICTFDVIPGPGGASRRLVETLEALSPHFEPEVLAVKGPDQPHLERMGEARVLRVPVGQGSLPQRAEAFERAVRRQLESDDYAAVHFSDPFGGYVLCEARGSRTYKLVYEALRFPSHELRERVPELETDRKFLSRVRRRELFCLMRADRVITGSHVTRNFVQSLGVGGEQVAVLPTPVEVDAYPVSPTVQRDVLRCLYLGDGAGWQGLDTLLRGIALASAEIDVALDLVGVPPPTAGDPLDALVRELGIAHLLQFHGPVQNHILADMIAPADVALLPLADCERNRLQGGPLDRIAPLLASGKPLVASDLPLTRERLPGGCALFHRPGDAAALSAAILELARHPRKREEMGRRARTEAARSLDRLPYRARLLRLYGELLGSGTRPPGGGGRGQDAGSGSSTTDRHAPAAAEEQTDSGFAGPQLESLEVRPQVLPRSRLRSPTADSKQVTRVARIPEQRPAPAPTPHPLERPAPSGREGPPRGPGALLEEEIGSALPPPSELEQAHLRRAKSAEPPRVAPSPPPARTVSGAFPRIGGGASRDGSEALHVPERSDPGRPAPVRTDRERPAVSRPSGERPAVSRPSGERPAVTAPPPRALPSRPDTRTLSAAAPRRPTPQPRVEASGPLAPPPLPPPTGSVQSVQPPPLPREAQGRVRTGAQPAVPPPLPPGHSRPRRETLPPELNGTLRAPRISGAGAPPRSAPEDDEIPEVSEVSEVSAELDADLPRITAQAREAPTEAIQLPEDAGLMPTDPGLPSAGAPVPAGSDPAPADAGLLPTDPGVRAQDALADACFLPGQKDPWLLQVLQGYCPPGNAKSFSRHAPPTTFPGRAGSAPRSAAGQKVG
ncbi:MAG TPA: glycosyltransferase [Myxococcaceae bacterium]|nr:glycosyltransferase [Myxococcaceae bacterium]